MNNMAVHFSSAKENWGTPVEFYRKWDCRYLFEIDVCAHAGNHKAPKYWTTEDDALTKDWAPLRCWMNPPYGRNVTGKWVKKAYDESVKGALVCCLLPARTDVKWFHDYCLPWGKIEFIRGRLTFEGAKDCAPFPSMIVVFGGGR